jgi:hypothetical protein
MLLKSLLYKHAERKHLSLSPLVREDEAAILPLISPRMGVATALHYNRHASCGIPAEIDVH